MNPVIPTPPSQLLLALPNELQLQIFNLLPNICSQSRYARICSWTHAILNHELYKKALSSKFKPRDSSLALGPWVVCFQRTPRTLEHCIYAGLDVNQRQEMGHPFLIMWAASVGNLGMVQLLIDSGTNTCATTEKGDTALHFARARPDPVTKRDVCRLLVEVGGANINARNENGETPLYRAVVRYDIKKVDVLLQIGADPKICNKAGESPLEAALRWESDKIVEMIILYLKTGPEAPLCAGAEGLSGQPC